jgi:hypothetical protein
MIPYPKIMTVFKRTDKGVIIPDKLSDPVFEYLWDNDWLATEKIDGTNVRVGYSAAGVQFGGRTDKAQMPVTLVNKLAELFPEEKMAEVFPDVDHEIGVTLYGEGYGAGIQKGGWYITKGVDFILFDVRIGKWWLRFDDVEKIAEKLGIKSVPRVGTFSLGAAVGYMEENVYCSSVAVEGGMPAEGLVLRPAVDDLQKRSGQRIIAKLKHRDFERLREWRAEQLSGV